MFIKENDTETRASTQSIVPVELLIKFSHQIGKGMDYISQRGIVHRDLAARNCMLTSDMDVKVSDFGLARVLEEGKDYYRTQTNFALPLRWMALESITDFLFTTESDVVS
jgi:serine/threonine protein kinase